MEWKYFVYLVFGLEATCGRPRREILEMESSNAMRSTEQVTAVRINAPTGLGPSVKVSVTQNRSFNGLWKPVFTYQFLSVIGWEWLLGIYSWA